MEKKRQVKRAQAQKIAAQPKPFYSSFEGVAMSAVSAIPIPLLGTWIKAYFNPEEALESEKANATLAGIAANLIFAGAMLAVVSIIINIGLMVGNPSVALPHDALVLFLSIFVILPIIVILFGFIGSAVLFILSKLLGGSGGYTKQTLGIAMVYGGWTIIAAPFTILAQLPAIGDVFSLLAMIIQLFMFYSIYRVVKSVHSLSSVSAALVVVVPLVLLLLLASALVPYAGAAA
jgi:hypothetical protein